MADDIATTRMFAALADEMRWQILQQIASEPASASALAQHFPISRQAVAKHIAILSDSGLVQSRREGRELVYEAVGAALSRLAGRLESIGTGWDRRLARLRSAVEDPEHRP